jgi:nucleoside-diphosphate-sugar epimerase
MRVLVTGLSGFTGYYVKQALEARSIDVIGLESDLTDNVALNNEIKQLKPDAVIHLAAIAFITHNNINDFYNVNLIGTRNLLEAIYQNVPKVKSILLSSSANVYGNCPQGILTEETIPQPTNDYAVSKLAMEKMALLWLERLPLYIVRPFNYTGVGQTDTCLIPKIVNHFIDKKPIIELGNVDIVREFNDVRMIADIYATLINNSPVGEILNVCTGQGHSIRDIIALCERISGHTIQIETAQHLIRNHEIKSLVGDPTKLNKFIDSYTLKNITETLTWMFSYSK